MPLLLFARVSAAIVWNKIELQQMQYVTDIQRTDKELINSNSDEATFILKKNRACFNVYHLLMILLVTFQWLFHVCFFEMAHD